MIEKYLNKRFLILFLYPFILGSLAVLSFQPFNLTFINFFILPSLFYLIIFIKKKSRNIYRKKPFKINLFIYGSSFGFGFFLSGIHWISYSLTFDESFQILIPFSLIIIPLFLSLFFSLIFLVIGPYLNLNFQSILLFSGGLAFSDFLRDKILSGFPWNIWAYSFSWSTEMIQFLYKFGLFTFNLFVITIFLLPSVFFLRVNVLKKIFNFFLLLLLLFLFYLYGSYSLNSNTTHLKKTEDTFYLKVISPNFELKYGLDNEEINQRLDKLIKYSDPKKNVKTLFVWPEGVFSGYSFKQILNLKDNFSKNFDKGHYILFGVNRIDEKRGGFYNTLVVINNQMEILGEYRKQKLVPFGEFLPFEKLLNEFGFKKITEGHGSFLKGKFQKNLVIDKLNILPLICYEIIFTKFIQKSERDTNLIVNISEDGWFGNSIGPYQHFAKGIFRAVEQNSFLIRSANKGVTAIINNKGEVVKRLNPNEVGSIELEVPLIKSKNKNKNDLIFFVLLITYIFIFYFYKKNNDKK